MLSSAKANRRTILRLMGSCLASISLSLVAPLEAVARTFSQLPDSLARLPMGAEAFRQARRQMRLHPVDPTRYRAAQRYLRHPGDRSALGRFEGTVQQDFVSGRVAVVDGWVISETELAVLALLKRP